MKTQKPGTILFIYKDLSHFVKKDLDFISHQFNTVPVRSSFPNKIIPFLGVLFRQFFILVKHISRSDVIFCWFADYHSCLPILFSKICRKRSFLVLGGYDVKNIPELKYGSFSKPIRRFCAKYSIKNATLNLPVTESLVDDARRYIENFKFRILPTGYDPEAYTYSNQKEKVVLTISITDTFQRYKVKGLDRFVELAKLMPDFKFKLVGVLPAAEYLFKEIPQNMELLPPLAHDILKGIYRSSMFYAQFSRSEGMPNTICEAMLSKCIPIGLKVGGIPDVIGDSGILFDDWKPVQAKQSIEENFENKALADSARERVMKLYSIKKREQELNIILNS